MPVGRRKTHKLAGVLKWTLRISWLGLTSLMLVATAVSEPLIALGLFGLWAVVSVYMVGE